LTGRGVGREGFELVEANALFWITVVVFEDDKGEEEGEEEEEEERIKGTETKEWPGESEGGMICCSVKLEDVSWTYCSWSR
jgi:hypothetical protein